MLTLPKSLRIKRAHGAEETLLEKSRAWLALEKRDPRTHVSDILDPRSAYWQKKKPKKLSDKLVTMFLIGKVLHSFVLSAVDGVKSNKLASDDGSRWNEELGISYSMDKLVKGIPRELKTSRTYYEPKSIKDVAMYCEQLLCYMVCECVLKGQLWLLLLNAKDETKKTCPVYRCYTITVTQADLDWYKAEMLKVKTALEKAWKRKDPSGLPLCRRFKCGEGNCEWWKNCKPPGRYGKPYKEWTDTEASLIMPGRR